MSVIHARCRCLLTLTRRLTLAQQTGGGGECHTIVGFKQPKDDVDAGNFIKFYLIFF